MGERSRRDDNGDDRPDRQRKRPDSERGRGEDRRSAKGRSAKDAGSSDGRHARSHSSSGRADQPSEGRRQASRSSREARDRSGARERGPESRGDDNIRRGQKRAQGDSEHARGGPRRGFRTGGPGSDRGARRASKPHNQGSSGGPRKRSPERQAGSGAAAGAAPGRAPSPAIPEDITGLELDSTVRAELGTLSRPAAERVARHLVAAGQLLDDDPETALAHAMAARREGYRLGVVREACGYAAYAAGHFEQALAELRAARRMTGSEHYVPVMADSERGLGRPERALELAGSVDRGHLDQATRIELLIVEAGARRDLGQSSAALGLLDVPDLHSQAVGTAVARLRYAYADALEEVGRREEAAEWFARAAAADVDTETDADERRLALQ
jgi:hypothetical protein